MIIIIHTDAVAVSLLSFLIFCETNHGERTMSWVGASSSPPWLLRSSSSFATPTPTTSFCSKFFKYQSCPPSRLLCLAQSNLGSDFNFVLHDALDSSGTLTSHARVIPLHLHLTTIPIGSRFFNELIQMEI